MILSISAFSTNTWADVLHCRSQPSCPWLDMSTLPLSGSPTPHLKTPYLDRLWHTPWTGSCLPSTPLWTTSSPSCTPTTYLSVCLAEPYPSIIDFIISLSVWGLYKPIPILGDWSIPIYRYVTDSFWIFTDITLKTTTLCKTFFTDGNVFWSSHFQLIQTTKLILAWFTS